MLASWIVLFSLWSRSQGVLLGSIAISLNPMIDFISDFGWLNSLFNAIWISTIPAFWWSFECLIYHVSVWSCSTLTKVTFLMLSSVTPYASHTTLTMNQNWYASSFPTPLNIGNLIALIMLNCWLGRGHVGEDGGDLGDVEYVEMVTAVCVALSNWPHSLEKLKRTLTCPLMEVKLKDCFLTLRYLCRPFHSTSFHSLMYLHYLSFT